MVCEASMDAAVDLEVLKSRRGSARRPSWGERTSDLTFWGCGGMRTVVDSAVHAHQYNECEHYRGIINGSHPTTTTTITTCYESGLKKGCGTMDGSGHRNSG